MPYADNIDAQIFCVARLPRVLAAALVGSSLALAGVVFQALLRNPLASPDTLGVSAGASLGAMIAITFNLDFSLLGVSAVPLASFAGSFGALGIVYGLSAARRRGTSTMVLLLGGVTVQALLSAIIAFVQYLADFTQTFRNVRWLMGSLDVASYPPIAAALIPMSVSWIGFATLPRVLDLISVGMSRPPRAASTWSVRNAWRSSAPRWRRARPWRSPVPFRLSESSCRTSSGSSSAPIIGWCCRRRRCSARRF